MPRFNKDPNPAAAVDLTGITASTSAAAVTPTRVTGLGSTWARATGARAVTPASPGTYTDLRRAGHNPGTALDGLPCSGVLQWSSSTAQPCTVYLVALDSAGTGFTGLVSVDITPTAAAVLTTRLTYPALPASTRRVALWVRGNNAPAGWQVTTGLSRLEMILDPNLPLADGDSDRWAWDGTAGVSTSTRAADDGAEWWALAPQL